MCSGFLTPGALCEGFYGLESDVIGKAHGVFGIPSSMKTYPWFESDKTKKDITLARALEDRIVFGLNDDGWNAVAADYSQLPSQESIRNDVQKVNAEHLILLILNDWFVRINLNWVSAFNFDWDVTLKIYDSHANLLMHQSTSGRDVVDEKASESPANHIRQAFRDRVEEIIDTREVRDALAGSASRSVSTKE